MYKVLIVFLFTCTLAACKKKNNNGSSGNLVYQPVSANSEWNYVVTGTANGGSANSSYKLVSLGRDTMVGSRTYAVFSNSLGPNEYYNQSGSDYYRFARLAELNNQQVELLYLKDNLGQGQSWVETKVVTTNVAGAGSVQVTAKLTFTIAARDIDFVVNGTTFKNVIKLTTTPEFTAIFPPLPVPSVIPSTGTIEYYYARNVGLIYNKTVISIPLASVAVDTETKLSSYTIR
jgi:hypothetical protein